MTTTLPLRMRMADPAPGVARKHGVAPTTRRGTDDLHPSGFRREGVYRAGRRAAQEPPLLGAVGHVAAALYRPTRLPMLTSNRSSITRRSTPLLAGVLILLQVLTGFIICAGPGGIGTSSGVNEEYPRPMPETSTAQLEDAVVMTDAGACVTSFSDDAPAALGNAVPTAPLLFSSVLPSSTSAGQVASAPAQRTGTLRGPPQDVSRSIRSVVLRI